MVQNDDIRRLANKMLLLHNDVSNAVKLNTQLLKLWNDHTKILKAQIENINALSNKMINDFGIINKEIKTLATKSME